MFLGHTASLANPISRSALPSHGTRPSGFMVFSVGDIAGGEGYMVKDAAGNLTVDIKNGVATFSVSQTHLYVGIGDVVTYEMYTDGVPSGIALTCHLVKKISCREWMVLTQTSETPDNATPNSGDKIEFRVLSIDKTFPSLSAAIDSTNHGASDRLGTLDLTSLKMGIYIACYAQASPEVVTDEIVIEDWVVDQDSFVKIKAPYNIATECNSVQRKVRTEGEGYRLSCTTDGVAVIYNLCDYTVIEGLRIVQTGTASSGRYGIRQVSDVVGSVIQNNHIEGSDIGVYTEDGCAGDNVIGTYVLANEVINSVDEAIHIGNNQKCLVANNTCVGGATGIKVAAGGLDSSPVVNCICQDFTVADFDVDVTQLEYCISSDASVTGGTVCSQNTIVAFYNRSQALYSLSSNDGTAIDNGTNTYHEGVDVCPIPDFVDMDLREMDNTWSAGAYHYTRRLAVSIGCQDYDFKTASTATVSNGIMSFSVVQSDPLFTVGCVIELDGHGMYYVQRIYERSGPNISKVVVTGYYGDYVGDVSTPADVLSAKYVFPTFYEALQDDGSGISGLNTQLLTGDLVTLDVSVLVVLGRNKNSSNVILDTRGAVIQKFVTDKSRNIVISTSPGYPTALGVSEELFFERGAVGDNIHHGIVDLVGNNFVINDSEEHGENITIQSDYTELNGIQVIKGTSVPPDEACVRIIDAECVKVLNNILVGGTRGVSIDSNNDIGNHVVAGNLIYQSQGHGVEVLHNYGNPTVANKYSSCSIYWSITALENNPTINDYSVEIISDPYSLEIEWYEKKLTIKTTEDKTMTEILALATVYGKPWGIITVQGSVGVLGLMPLTKLSDFADEMGQDGYVPGSAGTNNKRHYIYNNTIIDCVDNGVFIETLTHKPHYNQALLKNNLAQGCGRGYASSVRHPDSVVMESCWSDDNSINEFEKNGNCEINKTVKFRNKPKKDYHLKLFSSLLMVAEDLRADPYFQIFADYEYNSKALKCDIGCDRFLVDDNEISFSVGQDYTELYSGAAQATYSIDNEGIITFSIPLDDKIGIGDKVHINTGFIQDIFYLVERGNQSVWRAVTYSGDVPSPSSGTITSIVRCFQTIKDAIDTDSEGIVVLLLTRNLLGNVNIVVYNDNATAYDGDVEVKNWTHLTGGTGPKVTIMAPWDIDTQCAIKQAHSGVWDDAKVRINNPAGFGIKLNNVHNVEIIGLQIETDNASDAIPLELELAGSHIQSNLIRNSNRGVYQADPSPDMYSLFYISFNIIYNTVTSGIDVYYGTTTNNTVYGCQGSGYVSHGNTLRSCIGYNNATDFSGTFDNSTRSNISKDASLPTSYGNLINVVISFVDAANNDFHLTHEDLFAISNGLALGFSNIYDIYNVLDIDFNPYVPVVGAHCFVPTQRSVVFSMATTGVDMMIGASPKINIVDGIAYFSISQNHEMMGIGDEVTYGAGLKCYLFKKRLDLSSENKYWEVKTKYGTNPVNASNEDVVSIYKTFLGQGKAFDDAAGNLKKFLGSEDNDFIRLDRYKLQVSIAAYKGANYIFSENTSQIVIYGFVTDVNSYIRLFTPYDTAIECNSRQRHNHIARNGLEYSGTTIAGDLLSSKNLFETSVEYTRFEGFILHPQSSLSNSGIVSSCPNVRIFDNIIFDAVAGIYEDGGSSIIANNIIYSTSGIGIELRSTRSIACNNTVAKTGGRGINVDVDNFVVNNIARECASMCIFSIDGHEYNIVDDTSISDDNHNINQFEVSFEDYANDDYRLSIDDSDARGSAKVLFSQGILCDSVGLRRDARWDRGALEYVPVKSIVYSVGIDTSNFAAQNSLVTFTDGIATFNKNQSDIRMGVGDVIDYGSSQCVITEKISQRQWRVLNKNGSAVPDRSPSIVVSIKRCFNSLNTAVVDIFEPSYLSTSNLVGSMIRVGVACYNDGDIRITSSIYVPSYTQCDADYFIRIFSPRDTLTECNKSQRHYGKLGNGSTLVLDPAVTQEEFYVLRFNRVNNVVIEGLIIRQASIPIMGDGLRFAMSLNLTIVDNILFGFSGDAINNLCGMCGDISDDVIVNNLIYDCDGDGIHIECIYGFSATEHIYNNTIVNCKHGLKIEKNAGFSQSLIRSSGNLVQRSLQSDYAIDNNQYTGIVEMDRCISQDQSAMIVGETNYVNRHMLPPSTTQPPPQHFFGEDGNFNLSKYDYSAVDNGPDMSDNPVYYYTYDIVFRNRPNDYWDIGAFEIAQIYGTGVLRIGPVALECNNAASNSGSDIYATSILYLRKNFWPDPSLLQFHSIEEDADPLDSINGFLDSADGLAMRNIIIYVESKPSGAVSFQGGFKLHNRGTKKTVIITTDPAERQNGPAIYKYGVLNPTPGPAPIVDDVTAQKLLTFLNMKVYCAEDGSHVPFAQDYLLGQSAATKRLKFVNSIVQVNKDALIQNTVCNVDVINCDLVYSNLDDGDNLYIAKTAT